jgi:hypothetical protein
MRVRFMELLRYAPHLNTTKLKVNKFMFGLNVSIHEKVRILMPQMLHDVVQKTLIFEEDLQRGSEKDSDKTCREGNIWCVAKSSTN